MTPFRFFLFLLLLVHVWNLPPCFSLAFQFIIRDVYGPSPVMGPSISGHALASPRSSSTAVGGKSTSCPLCSRKTWAQQEQDLWRLERWLEHAENQFRVHERIPTNMEQLEDTVQDFRVRRVTIKF
jgi:hypothetical protein